MEMPERKRPLNSKERRDVKYQESFVAKIIDNLKEGYIVSTSKRFLRRFMHANKIAKVQVHIKVEEPWIRLIPKTGCKFPPEILDMRRLVRIQGKFEYEEEEYEEDDKI